MKPTSSPLHTRPDGSIDTAFYVARGRVCRSRQFHDITRSGPAKPAPTTRWFRGWFG